MKKVSRRRAEDAVGVQHRSLLPSAEFRGDYPNHFRRWEDALVDGIPSKLIEHDFGGGSGGELYGSPPKFCAAYSSSALCANSFGPARGNPSWLSLGDHSGYPDFKFEWKLRTGLSGTPPNLDFVATSKKSILAVESKFLETLDRKVPKFAESYEKAYAMCGCSVLDSAYRSILEGASEFRYLDAAQLLKHALGVMHYSNLDASPVEKRTLGYVFWEPENRSELEPYLAHREELTSFKKLMEGSTVEFFSMNYESLWKSWQQDTSTKDHADALIRRYTLSL